MGECWVPVEAHEIRPDDKVRGKGWAGTLFVVVGSIDGQDLVGASHLVGGDVILDDVWYMDGEDWERLESDDAPVVPDGCVVLPAPPDGAGWQWRRVDNELHDGIMGADRCDTCMTMAWSPNCPDCGKTGSAIGGRVSERYRELNADPEPEPEPIGPGMWVKSAFEDSNEWRNSFPRFFQDQLRHSDEFVGWWTVGEDNDQWAPEIFSGDPEAWQRCTPDESPDNAPDLYDLLGIEGPT